MTPGTLVLIKWLDAYTPFDCGWKSEEDTEEEFTGTYPAESVGWMIAEDKDYYRIVSTQTPHSTLGHFSIPKGCVKSIKVLRKAK